MYHLSDVPTPTSYDTENTKWLGLEIRLNRTEYEAFGTQYHWSITSNSPTDKEYHDGVDFWVINENQLSGKILLYFLIIIAILATSISSLGSATLTGLYIIVLLTVGSYFRSFLVPTVTDVIYSTLPDPQPLRELISGLYITRNIRYE